MRYVAPLTLITAAVMIVFVLTGARIRPAVDLANARSQLHVGWLLAAFAWVFQLVLVAAAAPMVRAVAAGRELSQVAALVAGVRNVLRAAVPIAVVLAAIVLGMVAVVVPGFLLLGSFSLTGASERLADPLPAALADSAAIVRAHAKELAVILAIILAADLAVAAISHLAILPTLGKKPTAAQLAPVSAFVRTIAYTLVAFSAVPGCLLASFYTRKR